MVKITSRKQQQLTDSELEHMKALIFEEGPNEWNYLTEESVKEQMDLIRDGKALAVIAQDEEEHNNNNNTIVVVGFAVLILGQACPERLNKYQDSLENVAYINDVVVAKKMAGQGVGTRLLLECVSIATTKKRENSNCNGAVYIERHEENLASAGMMRKAGFEVVETIFDPTKRFSGSRKTSILVKRL